MRTAILWGLLTSLALVSQSLPAQSQAKPMPEAALMPWRIFGVESEYAARAKQDLEAARRQLASEWLADARPLSEYLGQDQLSLNNRRLAQQITVGKKLHNTNQRAWLIEPVLCSVASQMVVALVIADLNSDHYLAITHRSYQTPPLIPLQEPDYLRPSLHAAIQGLSAQARQILATENQEKSPETLRIGLRLAQETTRRNQGSSLCLNLLLAQTLLPEFRILHGFGNEAATFLRDRVAGARRPARSTRNVVLTWQHQAWSKTPRLPMDYRVNFSFVESVFGTRLQAATSGNTTVSLSRQGTQLLLTPIDAIREFLTKQSQALTASDLPQIAKIDRAWVYVDRGRAWGLNMNDRLVVAKSPTATSEDITGHVVGFFGPGLRIKSPRGFDVDEGAIVFIRKGQKNTKVGQTLAFDPQIYPTDWPPRAK